MFQFDFLCTTQYFDCCSLHSFVSSEKQEMFLPSRHNYNYLLSFKNYTNCHVQSIENNMLFLPIESILLINSFLEWYFLHVIYIEQKKLVETVDWIECNFNISLIPFQILFTLRTTSPPFFHCCTGKRQVLGKGNPTLFCMEEVVLLRWGGKFASSMHGWCAHLWIEWSRFEPWLRTYSTAQK